MYFASLGGLIRIYNNEKKMPEKWKISFCDMPCHASDDRPEGKKALLIFCKELTLLMLPFTTNTIWRERLRDQHFCNKIILSLKRKKGSKCAAVSFSLDVFGEKYYWMEKFTLFSLRP
jgi:hypothetical protein